MRLIDADELKRELSHAIWLPEWEHIRDKVLKDIDLQPTAYDPDKVVEQLEMEVACWYNRVPINGMTAVIMGNAFKEAIEIVKKVGAE